jgi:hypothetical protein
VISGVLTRLILIMVNGKWTYLYRTVDKEGYTLDYMLRANEMPRLQVVFSKTMPHYIFAPDPVKLSTRNVSSEMGFQ